jgi:translation initiation factor IF-1
MKERNTNKHLIEMVQTALHSGQEITIAANGWSMYPCLLPADIVKIHPTPFADLKKGDVIVFQRKEQLIVHRYIAPNKSQGDACLRADEPINATNYLGKITAFQRKNKEMKAIDRLAFWKFTALKLGKLSHFIQWMLLRIRLKFIRN